MVNHDVDPWQRQARAENERAAELAAQVERLRLERDAAKAELLDTARRHRAFRESLREAGKLADATEGHILNAMRHARANADASAQKTLGDLVTGLSLVLDPELFSGDGTPLPAWTADDPRTLARRVRAEVLTLRADRTRTTMRLDELVRNMARALDMPSNTPPANLVSRAAALRREVSALHRQATAAAQATDIPAAPWEDVRTEFAKLVDGIGELLREKGGTDR